MGAASPHLPPGSTTRTISRKTSTRCPAILKIAWGGTPALRTNRVGGCPLPPLPFPAAPGSMAPSEVLHKLQKNYRKHMGGYPPFIPYMGGWVPPTPCQIFFVQGGYPCPLPEKGEPPPSPVLPGGKDHVPAIRCLDDPFYRVRADIGYCSLPFAAAIGP